MLLVDQYEPVEIVQILIPQVGQNNVMRAPLNTRGFGDYMWNCADGHLLQVERKQWPELLADVDDVEEQLGRELLAPVQETYLLVEGVASPTAVGIDTYTISKDSKFFRHSRSYPGSDRRPQPGMFAKVMAWFYQLDKAGVGIMHTSSYIATAMTIGSWYKNSQKDEHTTLRRYIRKKINVEVKDPQVISLMGLAGANLGEERAKALIERFGDVISVLTADPGEIAAMPGFGPTLEKKIHAAVGRTW
jgi:ERCC4-type nuclease